MTTLRNLLRSIGRLFRRRPPRKKPRTLPALRPKRRDTLALDRLDEIAQIQSHQRKDRS